jgi:excinuclease ABC subunit C
MIKTLLGKLPQKPGVYLFKDSYGNVLYIGKAINLKNRVSSYFQKGETLGPKTNRLLRNSVTVDYILVDSEIEALLLEANLIQKYQPKYNVDLKDGKGYSYIKITRETYPRVLRVYKKINDKSRYFGPYPNGTSVRNILKVIRHIFPFCTHKKPYKSCLFVHIGLCPGPGFAVDENNYNKTIQFITRFLQGKKHLVIQKLQEEMKRAAQKEDYHRAAEIKKQVEGIERITQKVKMPYEYLKNPNLVADRATENLKELQRFLHLKTTPNRVECYDISNIKGTNVVGSMVVMVNGQPENGLYRRFKIRNIGKGDDLLALEEVLKRRFRHTEWVYPNLIVVDGGENQVNRARQVITERLLRIPVIGLAKRFEEVYLPDTKRPIPTDDNPKAKYLLQEIRNEAHRFARAYHILLRAKSLFH